MADSDKQRALKNYLASSKKKYGDSSANFISAEKIKYDVISTGSFRLDNAMEVGGFPRGKIIEIYGDEGSGKTSLCTKVCANAQLAYPDEFIGWVDVEHALNLTYATQLGLDPVNMVFCQPSAGEQALDEMYNMAASGAFSVIVLDSVGGLATKRQLEKEIGEETIGEVARLLSNNVKKICDAASKTNTLVLFINQLRTNIGSYGSPPTTMGGKTLKFFASARIQVKKKEAIINSFKDPIGQVQVFDIKKNRFGIPFKQVETEFFFGIGFNKNKELIDVAIDCGLIEKGGAWFYPYPEDKSIKFQGKDRLIAYFEENENEFPRLEALVKSYIEDGVISEIQELAESLDEGDLDVED